MSLPFPNATLPPPGLPARSGELFANELAALVQDIQRTREWFNSQLDAQLASLHQLCAATHGADSKCTLSMATLFEAPRPVTMEPAPIAPAAVPSSAATASSLAVSASVAAAPALTAAAPATVSLRAAEKAITPMHQAIILPPTLTAALDPQLEQATLHELNNALTRAFSEISARGGMIS